MKKPLIFAAALALSISACTPPAHETNEPLEWIQLFNGKDLNDWTVKIAKHNVSDNYANTFRVEDSLLKVRYDGYADFDFQYGHIF